MPHLVDRGEYVLAAHRGRAEVIAVLQDGVQKNDRTFAGEGIVRMNRAINHVAIRVGVGHVTIGE